jgi:hypothetical protein
LQMDGVFRIFLAGPERLDTFTVAGLDD